MQFALGVLIGIVVGAVVLLATRAKESAGGGAPTFSSAPGWIAAVLGVIGATITVAGFFEFIDVPGAAVLMLAAVFGSAIIGIGGLIRRDRRWQNWVGAAVGGAPMLFWLFFAVAEVLFPH